MFQVHTGLLAVTIWIQSELSNAHRYSFLTWLCISFDFVGALGVLHYA